VKAGTHVDRHPLGVDDRLREHELSDTEIDSTAPPAAPEPVEPGPGARALRQALERAQQRAADAEERAAQVTPLQDEVAHLRRQLGVTQAGIDPGGAFAQGVLAAAAANGIDAPADVKKLALVMAAEARGELPTNGHRSEDARD
jgi:hypothetical protein